MTDTSLMHPAPIETHPCPPVPELRVLSIEDSPEHLEWITLMLAEFSRQRKPLELLWAPSIIDAAARLNETEVDVVLLDLGLPDLSGYRSHQAVRLIAPRVPVVVLTSDATGESRDLAEMNGVAGYLIKSEVTAERLCATIWEAYNRA